MCLLCPARVPNITMHLSRHRKLVPVGRSYLRPGDGERCFDRVFTLVWGA
jgi:hypothetical protein